MSNSLFPDITRELLVAICDNDFKRTETLLKNGAPVNGDTWETSPLYTAIEQDNFHMFMLFLYHHANLNVVLDLDWRGRMSVLEYGLEWGSRRIKDVCKEVGGKRELNKKLAQAIKTRDYDEAEKLLKAGAEPEAVLEEDGGREVDQPQLTIFDYAVYLGDEKMVRMLIDFDIRKNIKYRADTLNLAIYNGNPTLIELLLKSGKYSDFGLDAAAAAGNTDVIRLLLDHGANPDKRYLNGHSAADIALKNRNAEAALLLLLHETALSAELKDMYRAIYAGDAAKVRKLIDQGFNINQGMFTPLAWAAYLGNANLVKLLLEHGAVVQDDERRLDRSPVFLAAINGNTDVVRVLLDKGALVDSCDEYGWTLLHQAVQNGKTDLVELLLKEKAELIRAVSPEEACSNILCLPDSPLHLAVVLENLDVLKTFIRNNVSVDYLGRNSQTPLHFAVGFSRLEAVKLLVESGAHVNAKTGWGMTPLHMAAKNGNIRIIKYLIEKGADIDVADADGRTPLFCALENGHADVAGLLIKSGAEIKKVVSCKLNREITLLQLASRDGYIEIVKFLLTHRADVNNLDRDGITPLHLAVHYDHYEIVKLLMAYGADVNVITKNFEHEFIYFKKEFSPLNLARSFKIWKLLYEAGARPGIVY